MLPCYWIYQRVGAALVERRDRPTRATRRGSTPTAATSSRTTVDEVLELADRVGPDLPAAEAWRTREHFCTTARYEWMFWDAAWREETWPI